MTEGPIVSAQGGAGTPMIVAMTWWIVLAVLLAWAPLSLGLGLLAGPVLRRGTEAGAGLGAPLADRALSLR